jgi:hypothetical protein
MSMTFTTSGIETSRHIGNSQTDRTNSIAFRAVVRICGGTFFPMEPGLREPALVLSYDGVEEYCMMLRCQKSFN